MASTGSQSRESGWAIHGLCDPYDFYNLGEFDQKRGVATWYGTKAELLSLIETAHSQRLSLIADIVLNHNSGADEQEVNLINGQSCWTLFNPKSGKYLRNWECFHPSMYESWGEMTFGDMADLAHRNPYVYAELLKLARWATIGTGVWSPRNNGRTPLSRLLPGGAKLTFPGRSTNPPTATDAHSSTPRPAAMQSMQLPRAEWN